MIAGRGAMERVEIQVAIAFGASVHPFTIITPRVSKTVTISAGLDMRREMKSVKVIVIYLLHPRLAQFSPNKVYHKYLMNS